MAQGSNQRRVASGRPLNGEPTATQQITDAVGAGHAPGGVCLIISYLTEPGIVHHVGGQPGITLGELNGKVTSRVEKLAAALSDAQVQTTISAHIAADMWRKFMLITSYGGVGALSRGTGGPDACQPAQPQPRPGRHE